MPRVCKVCSHNKRLEVDKSLIRGKSKTEIAKMYGIPYHSIVYHAEHHLTHQLQTAMDVVEKQEALDLYQELQQLVNRTKAILNDAESKNQNSLALDAIKELRSNFSLIAQMLAAEKITAPDDVVQVHSLEEFLNHFLDANLQYLSSGEIMQMQKLFEKMQNRTKSRREMEDAQLVKEVMAEDVDYSGMTRDAPLPSEQRKSSDDNLRDDDTDTPKKKQQKPDKDLLQPKQIPGSRHSLLIRRAIARKIDRQNRQR